MKEKVVKDKKCKYWEPRKSVRYKILLKKGRIGQLHVYLIFLIQFLLLKMKILRSIRILKNKKIISDEFQIPNCTNKLEQKYLS